MSLKTDITVSEGFPVLALSDELDLAVMPQLLSSLNDLGTRGDRLIIDLSGVKFIDSSSIGELIAFDARLRERGAMLAITSAQENLRRIFRTRGLVPLLCFFDSLSEAAAFLESECAEPS